MLYINVYLCRPPIIDHLFYIFGKFGKSFIYFHYFKNFSFIFTVCNVTPSTVLFLKLSADVKDVFIYCLT